MVGPMSQLRTAAIGCLAGMAILLLVEVSLRLLDVGYSHRFFLAGGDRGSVSLYPNDKFANQYYPRLPPGIPTPGRSVLFSREKSGGTYRIFVIGESTSQGFPYVATEAFPFQMGQMLTRAGIECEVINLSMSAITSHVGLDIAREVAGLDPDLVLLYFGHNEFLGIGGSAAHTSPLFRLNKLASRLRIYQVIKEVLSPSASGPQTSLLELMGGVPGMPHGSDRYRATIQAFERNLGSIVDVLNTAGAEVLLLGVARNMRDFPPFRSHRAKDQGERDAFVAQVDRLIEEERFADEQFSTEDALESYLIGRALLQRRMPGQAKRYFHDACDFDLLRFRATSDISQSIRDVCQAHGGVYFDCQSMVDSLAGDGIAGNESFVDQVHPSLAVHHLLARKLTGLILEHRFPDVEIDSSYAAIEIRSTLVDQIKAASTLRTLYRTELFRELGYYNDLGLRPVFRSSSKESGGRYQLQEWVDREDFEYIQSVYSERPAAYQLHINYGAWLLKQRRSREAFAEFRQAHLLNRLSVSARNNLALVYVNLGLHDEAEMVLRELADVGVDDPRLYESLYRLHVVAGRHEEARKLRDELMADGTQVEGDLRGLRLYEY